NRDAPEAGFPQLPDPLIVPDKTAVGSDEWEMVLGQRRRDLVQVFANERFAARHRDHNRAKLGDFFGGQCNLVDCSLALRSLGPVITEVTVVVAPIGNLPGQPYWVPLHVGRYEPEFFVKRSLLLDSFSQHPCLSLNLSEDPRGPSVAKK